VPAAFVEHGGRFIQGEYGGFHSKYSGKGKTLPFSAGKKLGRPGSEGGKVCICKGLCNPASDSLFRKALILWTIGCIFFHHGAHNLVVRILQESPDNLSDRIEVRWPGWVQGSTVLK